MKGGLRQIYSTENESSPDSLITSLHFASSTVGWMIKAHELYQTQDGGATWNRVSIPEEMQPEDVYFRDGTVGVLVGARCRPLAKSEQYRNNALCGDDRKSVLTGFILKTSDGGQTWRAPDVKWNIGRFSTVDSSSDFGIVNGDAGCLMTADGGKTWKNILNQYREPITGEVPQAQDIFILDDNNAWIALSWAQVIATHDGGKSWQLLYQPTDPKSNPDTFEAIAFVDQEHGLAIAQQSGGRRLFKSSDAGKSWSELQTAERFRGLALIPKTRSGILLGDTNIYSISLR